MESPTKSSILDSIPTHLVKLCLPVVLPHLTSIVNKSLKAGVFPDSNLSFLSKTLGQLVTHQLVSHMDKFKLHDLLIVTAQRLVS